MDKYIGMDVDIKKTVACVVTGPGDPGRYRTIATDVVSMQEFLRSERQGGYKTHVVFEVRGEAGWFYDILRGMRMRWWYAIQPRRRGYTVRPKRTTG
jgi:hypothetical protein